MLAKITSELGKPAGLVVLSRAEALERFAPESPSLIPGIGPKSVARLEAMGVRTLAELRAVDSSTLEAAFGPRQGRWLHRRGRLEDDTPVVTSHETKSQSAETTFDFDVAERAEMESHVARLAERLCERLRKRDLAGRSVGIKVRLDDWTNVTRSRTLEEPTDEPGLVASIALDLLRAYDPPRPVRLLGVRVAGFGPGEPAAESADDDPQLQLGVTA
jgi:DNA polymerase-4